MKNGKHKVRVGITAIAIATVIFKNGEPVELDELQEVIDVLDFEYKPL